VLGESDVPEASATNCAGLRLHSDVGDRQDWHVLNAPRLLASCALAAGLLLLPPVPHELAPRREGFLQRHRRARNQLRVARQHEQPRRSRFTRL
jgi:hypothetical protein